MNDFHSPLRQPVFMHRHQQLGPGRGKQVRWLLAHEEFEFLQGWKRGAVLRNKTAERCSITLAANTARQEGQVNVTTGFAPAPERACGNILLDALRGTAQ